MWSALKGGAAESVFCILHHLRSGCPLLAILLTEAKMNGQFRSLQDSDLYDIHLPVMLFLAAFVLVKKKFVLLWKYQPARPTKAMKGYLNIDLIRRCIRTAKMI